MPTPPPDRDSPDYPWHALPADHNAAGLCTEGPAPERNPLVRLQGVTNCPISASDPDAERHQWVVYRARRASERRAALGDDDELEPAPPPLPRMVRIGNYWNPQSLRTPAGGSANPND